MGNELQSPLEAVAAAGDGGGAQHSQTVDLNRSRQLGDDIIDAALDLRGSKRKMAFESRGHKQMAGKRTSAAGRYPSLSLGSGLGFPPVGLNPSSLLGTLGQMNHPLLMAGSTLGDLQAMFPSVGTDLLSQVTTGNGHLPSSSSSPSSSFASTTTTMPMSSAASASTSSSSSTLASGSLPPYMMNPSMAGLLSSGFPLNYSQSLLSEPRMYPNSLLTGGLSAATPSSAASSFLSHFPTSPSSLLGAALSRPDTHLATENGGSSSDDDVIEVTGQ